MKKDQYHFKSAHQKNTKSLSYLLQIFPHDHPLKKKFIAKDISKTERSSFNFIKEKADQGDAIAQHCMGLHYLEGVEVKQSYEEAFKYFKLAADQGYPPAQYMLGHAYREGKGVQRSDELSFKYYQLASHQNHPEAQYQVGCCFKKGCGVDQSNEQAFRYFKLAADSGDKEAQFMLGELYRTGGRDFKEDWEKALAYYKLAAEQGHIGAIKFLFKSYHYGHKVRESQKEALKYLKIGVKRNDPECQYQLGLYYFNGKGGLNRSVVEAFKYWKLAASQGHREAALCLEPRILHPSAQNVNIEEYLQDHQISTLEKILKSHTDHPAFLEKPEFSWEEALTIREAMIANPRLAFLCSKHEISRLFLAFELAGYDTKKDLEHAWLVSPSTHQAILGCVFVGDDLRNSALKPSNEDPDPKVIERKRLQLIAESKIKENCQRAYQIQSQLPKKEILHPQAEKLDISLYLKDGKIDSLIKILKENKDKPIYFCLLKASHKELLVIRDAMIENPMFTFLCLKPDNYSLEEAFYQAGYHSHCLKMKKIKIDGQLFQGLLFKGERSK